MATDSRRCRLVAVFAVSLLATGCATSTSLGELTAGADRAPLGFTLIGSSSRGALLRSSTVESTRQSAHQNERTTVAVASPDELIARTGRRSARTDAFSDLLLLAGLDKADQPSRDIALTGTEAIRLLSVLMRAPLTPRSLPPRMAICQLLREVLREGSLSREELVRRVAQFRDVAILRPDGYLAWTLTGRTQQKVGPVRWKNEALRAGAFELGAFYMNRGGVFRPVDAQFHPIMNGPGLAEVYDDADYINRASEGAGDAFADLYVAMGEFLTRPMDGMAAVPRLPQGVAALILSSPAYLQRFRYSMTEGEQVAALAKLFTNLIIAFGTVEGTASTLARTAETMESTLPILSLSEEGTLALGRGVVPLEAVGTVLRGAPGSAIIMCQINSATGPEQPRGALRPAAEELLQQSTRLPPEKLNGFRIFGTKGLVGPTFQRNILLIEAEVKGATRLKQLLATFEAEARTAGASRLSITGHAVINEGFLKSAIAEKFGLTFRLINDYTIELVKELTP